MVYGCLTPPTAPAAVSVTVATVSFVVAVATPTAVSAVDWTLSVTVFTVVSTTGVTSVGFDVPSDGGAVCVGSLLVAAGVGVAGAEGEPTGAGAAAPFSVTSVPFGVSPP